MTREEAKRRLLNIERCTPIHTREDVRDFEALEMAIKALAQEPSGDLISRQAVIDACEQSINILEAVDRIMDLPSVNPQEPKTGHWIYDDECHEHGHCSECGYGRVDLVNGEPHNFCRRCGARMESEDKE